MSAVILPFRKKSVHSLETFRAGIQAIQVNALENAALLLCDYNPEEFIRATDDERGAPTLLMAIKMLQQAMDELKRFVA